MAGIGSTRARVALVGLGEAGFSLHLPALRGIAGAEVVGACDTDPGRRARAAQSFRVPVFDDFDAMLERASPDVVIIGTPPDSHADHCLRSLAAGAHVICEKPFVSGLEEADRVIAAARAAGRRVALNHEFREMPIFRALRAAAGDRVIFAQVWQLMDLAPWDEPGWRGQMRQRTLYEAGVHLVDFLIALFGEKPHAVSATVSTCGVRAGDTDAVVLATLHFSRGRLAQMVQNRLCKGQTQYFEVRAELPDASLRASFGGRARISAGLHRSSRPHFRIDYGVSGLAWKEVGSERTILGRNPTDPGMIATRYVFENTLAAFRDGSEPPASAEMGRDVLEVIAACYHAAATGQRVDLEGDQRPELAALRMGTAPVG
ncbi:MAG: Gfo/Idh/MocA family oxidoreductase [Gemmatimonadota bacterium]|nr:Gfo/Idh/MocA family oxidoreductase [Gemmatimonadota bacterium]